MECHVVSSTARHTHARARSPLATGLVRWLALANIAVIAALGMFPPALIEGLGLRLIFQAAFATSILAIFALGLLTGTVRQISDKVICLLLLLITALAVLGDIWDGRIVWTGYKFALLVPVLWAASEYGRLIRGDRLIITYWLLLLAYILATSAAIAWFGIDNVLRAYSAGFTRLKLTGSTTVHGVLCTIYLLVSLSLWSRSRFLWRVILVLSSIPAFLMMMLSASRQSVLIIFLFFLLQSIFARRLKRFFMIGAAGLVFFLCAAAYTEYFDPSLYLRMHPGASSDFSSGRIENMAHWLREYERAGGPLGFGYIGEHAETGEWPHNEPFRFFVEGGVCGILIVFLILGQLIGKVVVLARNDRNDLRRNFVLTMASVIFVQLMVENLFQGIFRAAFYFFVVSVLFSHHQRDRAQRVAA